MGYLEDFMKKKGLSGSEQQENTGDYLSDFMREKKLISTPYVRRSMPVAAPAAAPAATQPKQPASFRDRILSSGLTSPTDNMTKTQMGRSRTISPPAPSANPRANLPVRTAMDDIIENQYTAEQMQRAQEAAPRSVSRADSDRYLKQLEQFNAANEPQQIGAVRGNRAMQEAPVSGLTNREQEIVRNSRSRALAEEMERSQEQARQLGERNPAAGFGLSVASDMLGSAVGATGLAQSLVTGRPLDANDPRYRLTRQGRAFQQGESEGIKNRISDTFGTKMTDAEGNPTFASQAVDFGLGVAHSMAETLVRAQLGGGIATGLAAYGAIPKNDINIRKIAALVGGTQAGLSAATSAYLDARDKGAGEAESLAEGLAFGVAEEFFEKVGLEGLIDLKATPVDGAVAWLRNMGRQALKEGSEEMFTDWANILSDYLIMGGRSEASEMYRTLIDAGESPERASKIVVLNVLKQSLMSGLAGAISGTGTSSVTMAMQGRANVQTGRQMLQNDQNYTFDELQQSVDSIITDENAYRTPDGEVDENALDQAEKLKNYGEELLEKMGSGRELTAGEIGAFTNEARRLAGVETFNEGFEDPVDEEPEREIADMAGGYTGLTQELYSELYPEGMNRNRYDRAFGRIYAAGRTGSEELGELARNDIDVRSLPSGSVSRIFNAAKLEYDRAQRNQTSRTGLFESGLTKLTREDPVIAEKVKETMDDIGKLIGFPVGMRERLDFGADGVTDLGTGEIVLSFNADRGTMLHEIYHQMEKYDAANAELFKRYAMEAVVKQYGFDTLDALVEDRIDTYRKTNAGITRDEVLEELVADGAKAFADDEYINDLVNKDRTFAEKIHDILTKLVDLLKNIFDSVEDNYVSRALKADIDLYTKARDAYAAALENTAAARKEGYTANTGSERYSIAPTLRTDLQKVYDREFDAKENEIITGTTSDFLKELIGISEVVSTMPASEAYGAMVTRDKAEKDQVNVKDAHNLGVDGLYRALVSAERPVAAYVSVDKRTEKPSVNRITLVTSESDRSGRIVLVGTQLSSEGYANHQSIIADKEITAYGKRNIITQIEKASNEGRLLYFDESRSQYLISDAKGQSLRDQIKDTDFTNNIQRFQTDFNQYLKATAKPERFSQMRERVSSWRSIPGQLNLNDISRTMAQNPELNQTKQQNKLAADAVQTLTKLTNAETKKPVDRGVALTITKELLESGKTELVGKRVKNADDLAALAQVYRDPRFETLRYFFADAEGNLVFQTAVSSGVPNASLTIPSGENYNEYLDRLSSAAKKQGATTVYMLHNHPSGNVSPSREDMTATGSLYHSFKQRGLNLSGSIVIDHTQYALLSDITDTTLTPSIKQLPRNAVNDLSDVFTPAKRHAILGTKVTSAADLEYIAKAEKAAEDSDDVVSLIFTDSRGNVRVIQKCGVEFVNDREALTEHVRKVASGYGCPQAFAVTRNADAYNGILRSLYSDSGVFTDVLLMSGGSLNDRTDPSFRDMLSEFGKPGGNFDEFMGKKIEGFREGSMKFSLPSKDSTGRDLSEGQREFFQNSKVVDESGNLKVMYHGTPQGGFTEFRPDVSYFTDNKDYATNYSRNGSGNSRVRNNGNTERMVYEVYLNAEKPFDTRDPEVRKVWQDQFFDKYSRTPLTERGLLDWTDGYDVWDFIDENDLDYDAVVLDEGSVPDGDGVKWRGAAYMIRSPEQVKSVENKNPTSNADIRFSLKSPLEATDRLIALHNGNEDMLRGALEIGGFAMPSIAVTAADKGHNTYGDISVVFGRDSINPGNRQNVIYNGDAWTPTFPEVGYKVSDRVMAKLNAKLDSLLSDSRDLRNRIAIDNSNVPDNLKRTGGDFVKSYKDNLALKVAYLRDSGETVKIPMKYAATRSGLDRAALREAIRVFGDMDTLRNSGAQALNEYIEPIKDITKRYYEKKYASKLKLAETLVKDFGWSDVERTLSDAISLRNLGDIRKELDRSALEKMMDRRLNTKAKREAFESWLRKESEGIVEKKGIRNDRDYFTYSGNRRSFEQLYYDYSLANIVRAMQSEAKQGKTGFFTGGGNIKGAALMSFDGIEDVRANIDKLRGNEDADHHADEKTKAFDDHSLDVCQRMVEGKGLGAFAACDAAEVICETVAKYRTESRIYNYLKKEYGRVYNITPEIAHEIYELIGEAQDLPKNYFEAKLYRAVPLNEPLAYVVPRNTDKALVQELKDRGLNVVTYKSGDNADRLKKINGIQNARFSLPTNDRIRTGADAAELTENMRDMNAFLETELNTTARHEVSDAQISGIVNKVAKYYGSKMDSETRNRVENDVRSMYRYLAENNRKNVIELSRLAQEIGEDILSQSGYMDNTMQQAYPNLANDLKNYRIKVSEEVRKDIAHAYDSYAAFRKKYFGRLNLVGSDSQGVGIDTAYQELSEKYPELFPEDVINPADQIYRIAEVTDALRPVFEHGDFDHEEAFMVGQRLLQAYFDNNVDGQYQAKINEITAGMRAKYTAQSRELAKYQRAEIEELQKKAAAEEPGKKKDYYLARIRALKADRMNILAQIDKNVEQRMNDRAVKRLDREKRKELLKLARQVRGMKLNPQNTETFKRLAGDLDLMAVGISNKKFNELTELRQDAERQAALDPDYKALDYERMKNLFDRLGQRRISEMTGEEVADLTEQLIALRWNQLTYNKMLEEQLNENVATLGRRLVRQQQATKGINGRSAIASNLGKYGLYMLNPTRALPALDGYRKDGVFTQLAKELNDGQTRAAAFRQKSEDLFREVLSDKSFVNELSKPTVPIRINDQEYLISKGMRISLYLHSLNRQNLEHINYGGIKLPDAKLYEAGKYTEAYRYGRIIPMTPSRIQEIIKGMTPKELEFAKTARQFFNSVTKDAINETSMMLNGYEKAVVNEYFPIKTDPNFTRREVSGLIQDGTIEGMGMLKERVANAKNPILLEDVSKVIDRQIENTSRYAGLAIPVRNFNKVYGFTEQAFTDSAKNAVGNTWGPAGQTYIENLLRDIQNGGRRSENGVFDTMKSLYAGSVLNLNLGVAMKQAASYPFAATVLDTKALAAGAAQHMSKEDRAYMDSITPWGYMRRQGMSGTEVGEAWRQRSLFDRNPALSKIREFTNWIQMVDVATTEKLFKATESYIRDHYPDLEVRGEEYNRLVAEKYNEVLQKTQPSYGVMQRNEWLRRGDLGTKVFTAFKTQTYNMGGEMLDAWNRMRAYETLVKSGEVSEAELRSAKRQFGRTVTATLASQAMLAVLGTIASAVLHKMKPYRDEEGKVTAESIKNRTAYNFWTSFAGMTLGGAELQSGALAFLNAVGLLDTGDKWYDISVPAFDSLNDLVSSSMSWGKALGSFLEDPSEEHRTSLFQKTGKMAMNAVIAKGIPANNLYNMLNAVTLWWSDYKNDELGSFEAGEGLFGLSDTSNANSVYYQRMANDLLKGNWDSYITTRDRMRNQGVSDSTVMSGIKKILKENAEFNEAIDQAAEEYFEAWSRSKDYDTAPVKKKLGKAFSGNPELSKMVDSMIDTALSDLKKEDPNYEKVMEIKKKYEGSGKDGSKKKETEVKKLMRGKSDIEQRRIWRYAGYGISTYKKQ